MDKSENERAYLLKKAIHEVLNERGNGDKGEAMEAGYGKWWLRIKGDRILAVLTIASCVGFIGYLVYQHDIESKGVLASVLKSQAETRLAIEENRETQKAMIYVISLPQGEREQLKLARPRALMDMQR